MFKKISQCIILICIITIANAKDFAFEYQTIQNLGKYLHVNETILHELMRMIDEPAKLDVPIKYPATMIPLFNYFPTLAEKIPYISLGNFPTPINQCKNLGEVLGIKNLYIKRDDLSGKRSHDQRHLFDGNKVRKLEFLLAEAFYNKARTVITFGCVGSNHACATAVYCKELGLDCILMLKPQPNSFIVRRNLLLDLDAGASILLSPNNTLRALSTIHMCLMHKQLYGTFPYLIPTGASCPLGAIGFVNAAFELKNQIDAGLMPEPDRIYLPIGSAGTTVGLLLGIKMLHMKSKIYAIAVEPEETPGEFKHKVDHLFKETNQFLRNFDDTFPLLTLNESDIKIIYEYCGPDYGLFIPEAMGAIKTMYEAEKITLDGVYSGKAMAGLMHDALTNMGTNEVILFWNTFCSDSFSDVIEKIDYKKLPAYLHTFFEMDVQPLDFTK